MRPVLLSVAALCAASLFATVGWAADDEAYEIKTAKFTPKGKELKVNDKTVFTQVIKATDPDGKVVSNKKTQKTELRTYVEKTLAVEKDKRTKYSRNYTKAKDVVGDETENKPYHGRTIIYEGSDESKWKLSAEGKPELDADDLKDLADNVNKSAGRSDKILYPKKAVKVGDKWELDAKEVAAFFEELRINQKSFKGEGKLVKAYKKNNQQWGQIELTMAFDAPLGDLKGGKATLKATMDQPIDGSSAAVKANLTLTLSAKTQVEQNDMKFDVSATVILAIASEHDDEK